MLYYYMDGLDKKGPYTAEEILSRNLSKDTLIYSDTMPNWMALKSIPELNIKEQMTDIHVIDKQLVEPDNDDQSKNANLAKLSIPAVMFLIFGILISTGIAYLIVLYQQGENLKIMTSKIDEVLSFKEETCDYINNGVRVRLVKDKIKLFEPTDNDGKELNQFYELVNGGFKVMTLKKKTSGYDLSETVAGDMGFKVPEEKWIKGTNYGYGTSPGFSIPSYRGTVQNAYTEALKYITTEKENGAYSAGSYEKIKAFPSLSTDFYNIENMPPVTMAPDLLHTASWTSNNGSVFNTNWIVWLHGDGNHYEVVKNRGHFNKLWLIYSIIGGVISIIVYSIIRYRKKITVQIT